MKFPFVGAWIFSGRRDPEWSVDKIFSDSLFSYFDKLPDCEECSLPEKLGYRGSYLIDNEKKLETFNGVVKYADSEKTQWKKDAEKKIESLLLQSAPKGVLPNKLF